MSRPPIQNIELNEYLTLSECHPDSECRTVNWWLYDKRVGWNLSLHEKTREDALVEAIEYWANRYQEIEEKYASLKTRVDAFIDSERPPEDND